MAPCLLNISWGDDEGVKMMFGCTYWYNAFFSKKIYLYEKINKLSEHNKCGKVRLCKVVEDKYSQKNVNSSCGPFFINILTKKRLSNWCLKLRWCVLCKEADEDSSVYILFFRTNSLKKVENFNKLKNQHPWGCYSVQTHLPSL